MRKLLPCLALLALLSACAPGLERIRAFDEVRRLHGARVALILDDHRDEADALARYGREKASLRMAKRDANTAAIATEAVPAFTFSPLTWAWASDAQALDSLAALGQPLYTIHIVTSRQPQGEQVREALAFWMNGPQGQALPNAFPSEQIIGEALSAPAMRSALRLWDKRIQKLHRAALKHAVD